MSRLYALPTPYTGEAADEKAKPRPVLSAQQPPRSTPQFAAPVPYWTATSAVAPALAGNSGESFAEKWARMFEAVRPGERAFLTS